MLFTVGGVVRSDLMLAPIGIIAPLKHDFVPPPNLRPHARRVEISLKILVAFAAFWIGF